MDEIDQAQANDELFRESALRAHFAGRQNASLMVCSSGKYGDMTLSCPHISMSPTDRLCCDCGDEIEPARLMALPYAVRCIDCQSEKERRERHG